MPNFVEFKTNDKKISRSLFLEQTGVITFNEVTKKPCEGVYPTEETIIRFRNGFLHGGKDFDNTILPAIETDYGHVEYWDSGLLHRANGPAVISNYGEWEEYWFHGTLVAIRTTSNYELKIEKEASK